MGIFQVEKGRKLILDQVNTMSKGFLGEKRKPRCFENMASSVRKMTCDWRDSLCHSLKDLMCQAEELGQSKCVKILSRDVPLTEKSLSKGGLKGAGHGMGQVGQPSLREKTVEFRDRRTLRAGCGRVCLCHLRKDFSPWVWKWLPIDMQKALPALVLLIKMENMGLCDAFNHFGIVKSSGLWGPGRPWCEHKLA